MREFCERKREMHEMLSLAGRVGDPQYVGEAYYFVDIESGSMTAPYISPERAPRCRHSELCGGIR